MDVSSLSQTVTDLDSQTVLLSQPVMHPNNIGIVETVKLDLYFSVKSLP